MADADIEVVKVTRVTLVMDEEEAGYLYNALNQHLAGSLVSFDQPLGKVLAALRDAKVEPIKAWRIKGMGDYAALYTNLADIPERSRHEATQG